MSQILTYKGAVYPWHCDQMGHMNVMWYVGKFDEGTWHLLHAIGITPNFLRETNRGMAAVEQKIEYKRELLAGDIVEIYSHVVAMKEKVITFRHEMKNVATGELSAITTLTAVHLDKAARKAVPFPAEVAERAAKLFAPPAE